MRVDPYLYFHGRCEEAVAFYQQAIGAEVAQLTRFKDSPGIGAPPGAEDKIVHAELRIGDTRVLATDGGSTGTTDFRGFALAISGRTDAEAERLFSALCEGGSVQLPLAQTPFASRFGIVTDRFGVPWSVWTSRD